MVSLTINGKTQSIDADADTPLLWVLRDHLALTGTKFGCGMALCGACTVHLDGVPVRSCTLPLKALEGKNITTIEGVSKDRSHVVQRAWIELDVPQCGYCQSGQIMSAVALLQANPAPTDADIDAAMSGNICRCGTYVRIRKAVHRAAELHAWQQAVSQRPPAGAAPADAGRRRFLRRAAGAGGGLVLALTLPPVAGSPRASAAAARSQLNAWLRIGADDSITILVDRSEMGQGVYTALPTLLAEELEIDLSRITVIAAPVGDAYVNALNGGQITGTSNSVPDAWQKLRKAGAQARSMLIAAAAQAWHVDPSTAAPSTAGSSARRAERRPMASSPRPLEKCPFQKTWC